MPGEVENRDDRVVLMAPPKCGNRAGDVLPLPLSPDRWAVLLNSPTRQPFIYKLFVKHQRPLPAYRRHHADKNTASVLNKAA